MGNKRKQAIEIFTSYKFYKNETLNIDKVNENYVEDVTERVYEWLKVQEPTIGPIKIESQQTIWNFTDTIAITILYSYEDILTP